MEGLGGKVGVWRGIPLGTRLSEGPPGHGNLRVAKEAPIVHRGGTFSQRDNETARGSPASCLEKQPPRQGHIRSSRKGMGRKLRTQEQREKSWAGRPAFMHQVTQACYPLLLSPFCTCSFSKS